MDAWTVRAQALTLLIFLRFLDFITSALGLRFNIPVTQVVVLEYGMRGLICFNVILILWLMGFYIVLHEKKQVFLQLGRFGKLPLWAADAVLAFTLALSTYTVVNNTLVIAQE